MNNDISKVDDTFILADYNVLKQPGYYSGFNIGWRADSMRREWKQKY